MSACIQKCFSRFQEEAQLEYIKEKKKKHYGFSIHEAKQLWIVFQNPNPSLSCSYTAPLRPGGCRSLSVRVLLPLPFHRRLLLHLQPRPAGGRRAEIVHGGNGVTAPPQSCGTDLGTHPTASHLYYSRWIFTGGDREKYKHLPWRSCNATLKTLQCKRTFCQ